MGDEERKKDGTYTHDSYERRIEKLKSSRQEGEVLIEVFCFCSGGKKRRKRYEEW